MGKSSLVYFHVSLKGDKLGLWKISYVLNFGCKNFGHHFRTSRASEIKNVDMKELIDRIDRYKRRSNRSI